MTASGGHRAMRMWTTVGATRRVGAGAAAGVAWRAVHSSRRSGAWSCPGITLQISTPGRGFLYWLPTGQSFSDGYPCRLGQYRPDSNLWVKSRCRLSYHCHHKIVHYYQILTIIYIDATWATIPFSHFYGNLTNGSLHKCA